MYRASRVGLASPRTGMGDQSLVGLRSSLRGEGQNRAHQRLRPIVDNLRRSRG